MREQLEAGDWTTEADTARGVRGRSMLARSHSTVRQALALQSERRHDLLTQAIEQQVIPRLLNSRRQHTEAASGLPPAMTAPTLLHVEQLATLLLLPDDQRSGGFVTDMHEQGTSAEQLYLDLLAPAARRLGDMWCEDLCDFTEVTVGLLRLHHAMRALSNAFVGDFDLRRTGPRALLVQIPGEQHGLGLAMVAQFFRRAGWEVSSEPVPTSAELIAMVAHEHYGIVGISASCSDRIETLADDIRAIRRLSRNPAIGIMVGGPPFVEHPQLAAMVGADATASDGRQAVSEAHSLVSLQATMR